MVSISSINGIGSSFSDPAECNCALFPENLNDSKQSLLPTHVSMHSTKDLVKIFPGVWLVVLYLILLTTFEILSFILNDVLHVKLLGGVDEPFALLTAMNVGMWAFTLLFDRYLHFIHHSLRRFGYLQFFTKTKDLRRIPLGIFSLGNASLLLVVAFTGNHPNNGMLSLIRVYQIVASIEVFTSLVSVNIYLAYVFSFNKASKLPDVYQQDSTNDFPNSAIYMDVSEIGFKDSEDVEDVLEKQSEMIRYLQQHNAHLSRTILAIRNGLSKAEHT